MSQTRSSPTAHRKFSSSVPAGSKRTGWRRWRRPRATSLSLRHISHPLIILLSWYVQPLALYIKYRHLTIPLQVSFRDVGSTIATRLLETGEQLPSRPHVITMHGPRAYSMVDLQDALETVAGQKPRIDAIRPENLLDFYKTKLPPGKAEEIVEMNLAINGGGVLAGEMASPEGDVVRGPTTLVDTLRKLASGEVSKVASGAF